MSRGAHAGKPKRHEARNAALQAALKVAAVVLGLCLCAGLGWGLVTVTLRYGLLIGGATVVGLAVVGGLVGWIVNRRKR